MRSSHLLSSLRYSLKTMGVRNTIQVSRAYIGNALFPQPSDETVRRYRLGQVLSDHFDNTVAYGPFKGLVLSDTSWWGAADRGSMLLGFYEKEVLDSLEAFSKDRDTFIDIGAADGYYAIGAVASGLFSKSFCFELSEEGQAAIAKNAERNSAAGKVQIFGEAREGFVSGITEKFAIDLGKTVFLFDIEGAEFHVVNETFLQEVRHAALIIEIHDWEAPPRSGVNELVNLAEKYFDVSWLTMGARDLSGFTELQEWPDDDRWILCSESRKKLMRWLVLTPREKG